MSAYGLGGVVVEGAVHRQGGFSLSADFAAPVPGVTVLFGPSGAGKSTLLKLVAGLGRLQAGRISFDGEVLEDADGAHRRLAAHQRDIGMVFQDARLFPHLTVRGNLEYAARRAPKDRVQPELEEIAQQVEIADLLDRAVGKLSGGERSRVALARALLSAPRLLLLDEPFAALDGRLRRAFVAMLVRLARERALPMMVVTHLIDDAVELADHVVAVAGGAVVAAGEARTVMGGDVFRGLLDRRDLGVRLDPGVLSGEAAGQHGKGVWVRADNVLVAVEPPKGLSARNVWSGTLERIEEEPDGAVLLHLACEVGPVMARVTSAAVKELELAAGQAIWAVVKTHAV